MQWGTSLTKGIIVVALMALATAVTASWIPWENKAIGLEILKTAIQVFGVAVVGGFVAAHYKIIEARRALIKEADEFRIGFLRKFRTVYFDVKRARRMLRVHGMTDKFSLAPSTLSSIQLGKYRELMLTINNCQLQIEDLYNEVEIALSMHLPPDRTKALLKELAKMGSYLRRLVTEFERFGGEHDGVPEALKFASIPEIRAFTASSNTSFAESMAIPYRTVVRAIYGELSANSIRRSEVGQPRLTPPARDASKTM